LNLIIIEQHKRNFVGAWELFFVTFGGFLLKKLTPYSLRGHNFLNSISFLMIFNAPHVPIGGVQVLFRHEKMEPSPWI
jgi:hypothetical protein